MEIDKTAVVKLHFPEKGLAQPFFEELQRTWRLSVNVLQGKVTADGGRYVLELRGAARTVDALLRLPRTWDTIRDLCSLRLA